MRGRSPRPRPWWRRRGRVGGWGPERAGSRPKHGIRQARDPGRDLARPEHPGRVTGHADQHSWPVTEPDPRSSRRRLDQRRAQRPDPSLHRQPRSQFRAATRARPGRARRRRHPHRRPQTDCVLVHGRSAGPEPAGARHPGDPAGEARRLRLPAGAAGAADHRDQTVAQASEGTSSSPRCPRPSSTPRATTRSRSNPSDQVDR